MSAGEKKPKPAPGTVEPPFEFGSNPLRLSSKEWLAVAILFAGALLLVCEGWPRAAGFAPAADYRVPYNLSSDFWMYSRWCERAAKDYPVLVVGDSAIWGHYVGSQDTLPQCLGRLAGENRFANLGLSGLHPVAMLGLMKHYGGAVRGKKVLLHFAPLWMHAEEIDLRSEKEFHFQHEELAPQFDRSLKCYKADLETRLGRAVARSSSLYGLTNHVQISCFDNTSVPDWMMKHPYDCPMRAVSLAVPSSSGDAVDEPASWFKKMKKRKDYPWVMPAESLQWRAYREAVGLLRSRGNDVFVLVGPFNPHSLTPESQVRYRALVKDVESWVRAEGLPCFVAPDLPSEEYGDVSHPLKEGYVRIAKALNDDPSFQAWGR